ncbi:MAG: ABC transporter permease [Phycisphaerae bacterium]
MTFDIRHSTFDIPFRYIAKRIVLAVPTFFGITVVTFAVIHLAPGDPLRRQVDDTMSSEMSARSYEQLRAYFGLDQPLYIQYGRWVGRLLTLDLGHSFSDHRPVWEKIRERLGWTLLVALLSMVIGLLVAIPIGVYSAVRPNGWFDTAAGTILYGLYSVPSYVMAMVLIVAVVTLPVDWIPIRNAYSDRFDELSLLGQAVDLLAHVLLITICYTYPSLAFQTRFVRQNLLEVLQQDYIRTARAKGLTAWRVVVRHGFRNTLIPLITYLGLLFPTIVGGSAILEVMFNWPGIGRLMFDSVLQRDYPTVMALSVITAVLVQAATLLADLCYAWADPRIRHALEAERVG